MVLFYGIFTELTRKTTLRPREPEDEPSPHRAIGLSRTTSKNGSSTHRGQTGNSRVCLIDECCILESRLRGRG